MLTPEREKWISHLSNEDKITIVPWDSNSPVIFERVKSKIKTVLGEGVDIFHRGASNLGISGQDEIDIYIPTSFDNFELFASKLKEVFGEPRSNYPLQRVRFATTQDGKHVDVFVINEKHSDWTDGVKFDEYLKSHPMVLEAYRILKEQGSGLTVREYYRRKVEFVNQVLSLKLKVAIIGGGVMGLYISWKLSEAGHDVSVFDRRKEEELYMKPCSALVSERIRQFIPISDECVENVINSCIINFPKKKVRLDFEPKHLSLNKEKLIHILLDLNKKNGAKLFFEKEIKELPQGFDKIIGCDGALSVTRKFLGLANPKVRMGAQIISEKEDSLNITETFQVEGGFSWRIPKNETIEFGVLGKENAREIKRITAQEGLNEKDIKAAVVPSPGFFLNDAGLIFPKEDNVTLCGDAMGLAKPWSGGGVIWGLHAADILVKTFPDFKEYKKQTVRFFRFKVLKGQLSNALVQFLGKYFPHVIPGKIIYDNDFPSLFVAFRKEK